MKQLVVNFFGAPGSGKSTMAAAVFAALKFRNYNVELVREYAKELAWDGSLDGTPQTNIFNQQKKRQRVVEGQVDVIITDSPLLLSNFYGRDSVGFLSGWGEQVKNEFNRYQNMNYFVCRDKPYNPKGRQQTEEEADEISKEMWRWLVEQGLKMPGISGTEDSVERVVEQIIARLVLRANAGEGEKLYFEFCERFDRLSLDFQIKSVKIPSQWFYKINDYLRLGDFEYRSLFEMAKEKEALITPCAELDEIEFTVLEKPKDPVSEFLREHYLKPFVECLPEWTIAPKPFTWKVRSS